MALSIMLAYAAALSLPVWLVVEQLYSWRAARTHGAVTSESAISTTTPAHPRPFSSGLHRNTA